MSKETKSPAEILNGVVLNDATIEMLIDWADVLRESNTINKEQLLLTRKQDEYFTGKDGFVKDIAKAMEKDHDAIVTSMKDNVEVVVREQNRFLQLKLFGWVTLLAGILTLVLNTFK